MGKYLELEEAVFSIIASPEFAAEKLTVHPNNFTGAITVESLRLDIVTNSASYSIRSSTGFLIFQIFVKSGIGTRRACVIADILDKHLIGKTVKKEEGTLMFTNSVLQHYGVDKANLGLHLSEYTINYLWSNP